MRIRLTVIALLLTTSLANAQAVSPLGGSTNNAGSPPPALATPEATTPPAATGAAATPATARSRAHHTMAERFAAANITHDGKLTLEQAKAGHLRAVARDFAVIDKSRKGYVTLDEIKAHQIDQRAAHRAAKKSAQ